MTTSCSITIPAAALDAASSGRLVRSQRAVRGQRSRRRDGGNAESSASSGWRALHFDAHSLAATQSALFTNWVFAGRQQPAIGADWHPSSARVPPWSTWSAMRGPARQGTASAPTRCLADLPPRIHDGHHRIHDWDHDRDHDRDHNRDRHLEHGQQHDHQRRQRGHRRGPARRRRWRWLRLGGGLGAFVVPFAPLVTASSSRPESHAGTTAATAHPAPGAS